MVGEVLSVREGWFGSGGRSRWPDQCLDHLGESDDHHGGGRLEPTLSSHRAPSARTSTSSQSSMASLPLVPCHHPGPGRPLPPRGHRHRRPDVGGRRLAPVAPPARPRSRGAEPRPGSRPWRRGSRCPRPSVGQSPPRRHPGQPRPRACAVSPAPCTRPAQRPGCRRPLPALQHGPSHPPPLSLPTAVYDRTF